MKTSSASKIKQVLTVILTAFFWLALWEVGALAVGNTVILPSPIEVALRWLEIVPQDTFLSAVIWSVIRIFSGFAIGAVAGSITGIITAKLKFAKNLLSPLITVVKTTPVASFIILALMWLDKGVLPVFISFLMVYPLFQSNVEEGVKNTSSELLEMAQVYRLGKIKTVTKIYFPCVMPYFSAACKTALGMAWKAGIAAEVLSLPNKSIGKELYYSKVYIETADVFAWTLTVILLSLLIEKVLIYLFSLIFNNRKETKNDKA